MTHKNQGNEVKSVLEKKKSQHSGKPQAEV